MPATQATSAAAPRIDPLAPCDTFARRHIGLNEADQAEMLAALGCSTIEDLLRETVPAAIRLDRSLNLPEPLGENHAIRRLRRIMSANQVFHSYIGMGYHHTATPGVIQRNILENPGWYTAYTPYQAEIAQGRLEALFNYQTMVSDLTGLPVANSSLLDEGTAAAEAMTLCHRVAKNKGADRFLVAASCHPQTIDVVRTRAEPLGIRVEVGVPTDFAPDETVFGALLQYPTSEGRIEDYGSIVTKLHDAGALAVVAADLMSLVLLRPPGEFGADVVVGSTQRFGVPLGYGGPHAAYFATRDDFKRSMPGRLVGMSYDAQGGPAYRLALQTREQHIRRDRATSNICTAQVLLAVIAGFYGVYHGPQGLRAIAERIHRCARVLAEGLTKQGHEVASGPYFDTLRVTMKSSNAADAILKLAHKHEVNLRKIDDKTLGISVDEITRRGEILTLWQIFHNDAMDEHLVIEEMAAFQDADACGDWPAELRRSSSILNAPVFHHYHTETELLRYIRRLEAKDLSLTTSMIPLGSCTMKLNATTEMLPVTWPEVGRLHPFAPIEQVKGYRQLFDELEEWLAEITGMAGVSLQPNAGSAGEYAGLLAVRGYLQAQGQGHRNVCLIPLSAHGTNPASAVMAGMTVVAVKCDARGDIDMADLKAKAEANADKLAALMVTYPSTHGVFEETIRDITSLIHEHGGQVYMDGANLTAQVGLCRPGDFGVDVCHLNLHKTFCIPHGGGGPGVGPIAVAAHLQPYLPGHPLVATGQGDGQGAVAAAPWGSASILVISWLYISMLGAEGLRQASEAAILNANYIAHRIDGHFPVLYKGGSGRVAHECILDLRDWKAKAGITEEDAAKRLMDYGFHAPTMSWPVPGTMMVEPTESECKAEVDRFCDAMISIHGEMRAVASGEADRADNVLRNAPHTAEVATTEEWAHPYSREDAAYPAPWCRRHKYWPPVGRIDNVHGDRNLICTCPTVEELTAV